MDVRCPARGLPTVGADMTAALQVTGRATDPFGHPITVNTSVRIPKLGLVGVVTDIEWDGPDRDAYREARGWVNTGPKVTVAYVSADGNEYCEVVCATSHRQNLCAELVVVRNEEKAAA